jgi:hypothetical protein
MTLSPTVFTASGLNVAANSTYWIVLRALTGTFDWAWTLDNAGTGQGFQHTWAISSDGGGDWFSSDTFPTQFAIAADQAASSVPEPASFSMLAGGVAAVLTAKRYRRQLYLRETL